MDKVNENQFNKIEKLIAQFIESHPLKDEQTIQQFKAWFEINVFAQSCQMEVK